MGEAAQGLGGWHFFGAVKNVAEDKKETRHVIDSLDDIYNYADTLKQTLKDYLEGPAENTGPEAVSQPADERPAI